MTEEQGTMQLVGVTTVLIAMGLGQSVLFALLMARRRSLPGAKWLSLFHAATALIILALLINNIWKHQANQMLIQYLLANSLALGPLLWFYSCAATGKTLPLNSPRVWMHLLPYIALQLGLATGLATVDPAPVSEAAWIVDNYEAPNTLAENIERLVVPTHPLAYLIGIVLILRRNTAALKTQYSAIDHLSLRWLNRTSYALAAVFIAWYSFRPFAQMQADLFLALAYLVITTFLGLQGLRQHSPHGGVTSDHSKRAPSEFGALVATTNAAIENAADNDAQDQNLATVKYNKSTLTTEQATDIKAQLEQLMASERCFLEDDLTLAALASRLTLSPHHLSQVLNESMQTSFYDYINELRVAEVARCLRDPAYSSQTVLDIALASGFSSKTTFNTVFKRAIGLTPTAYRAQQASSNLPEPLPRTR
jgi:AraC-like DNA-binding protein